ncbi:MAG TPA: hypothetical protein VJQ84_03530 [Solirubrobacterales bacterium]|nr:hypothetical protein [Solirubrobacterales bacterium]
MRRSLVLAGVLFGIVLAAVPAFAVGAGGEVERELAFGLKSEGFAGGVFVSNNDGDIDATLILSRGRQIAYYSTPAKVTSERVTARFGSLGELDFRFAPKQNGKVVCTGAEEGEAVFEGTFVFTGENGYVQIEADRAEGSFQIYPEPKNCPQGRLAQRAASYHPSYSDEGATFAARAGSRAKASVREITVFDQGRRGPHKVFVDAYLVEAREGMAVARGVQLAAGSGAFHWNLEKGTASLRPPAPFTGSATFTRHGHDGHGTWRGSLGMPILGGEPVELAGREFRAFIHKGVPQDE